MLNIDMATLSITNKAEVEPLLHVC